MRRARALGNPTLLVTSLYGYGMAWFGGDAGKALDALEECIALTDAGASDVVYASALEAVARLRAAIGDRRGALEALIAAISFADETGNRTAAAYALWFGVAVIARFGAHEFAAVSAGIVDKSPHMPFLVHPESTSNPHVTDHARAVEAARAALGNAHYDDLEARGAAMTYEQMVDYALRELRALLDEPPR